ncbi:MAG: hypothetical protein ACRDDY_13325 [Clostridium sp.]|uniref:hypothetical protein n=1 Tax=Clostridium sp. TaxID=1506 RepID=UPI003EE49B46
MKKKLVPNQKYNLKIFFIGFIIAIITLGLILLSTRYDFLFNFGYHLLHGFGSDLGTTCEILFFIVVSLWVLRLIIRYLNPKTFNFIWKQTDKTKLKLSDNSKNNISTFLITYIKKFLIFVSKIIQKFHVPLALIGFVIIMVHVYIFLHLGFKWKIGYIFGALAAINLLIIFFSGFLRIFNKGFKSHKFLGILFIILMLLHIIFI